ncbi:hypothetical protein HJC23_002071 [Cyclotella cryptica]|uniref:Uncharacterized protein n=1 Tax=Cyclotella cryptica TaxID=29204 RepID=A0ABD3Q6R2_9STRA|eukprot:CCRYP_008313-RA/>CCRYP_008313-RA protein AED:0.26 eAED:0.26 QI:0/-1/0/1/-1/1/1/0/173
MTKMISPVTSCQTTCSTSISKDSRRRDASGSTKQVSFSEYSRLHVYGEDPLYRRCKFYSSSEYEAFRTRAASDAYKLRQLLAACPLQNAETIRLLIAHGAVKREDFLGIEHLISRSVFERVTKERRSHSALLLKRQEELQEKNELDACSLAEVLVPRSAKSAARARVRAAMAA